MIGINNIHDIESMTEELAFIHALDMAVIKDHKVYFVDFENAFGYSAIVFYGGRQIKYANDYQLHHQNKTQEELHDLYVREMTGKLFTDAELTAPLESYDDYERRDHFLHSFYPLRAEHTSAFYIGDKAPDVTGLTYCPINWAYFEDTEFVAAYEKLYAEFVQRKEEMSGSYEYWLGAFLREMYNHEYGINWQGAYDVVSVFAPVRYGECKGFADYLNESGMNEIQKKAAWDARSRYFKEAEF